MHFLRCMGSKFCVKFQRAPLKFHTKFWTHTPQNMNFTVFYFCVWVTISLNCDVISLSETGPRCRHSLFQHSKNVLTYMSVYFPLPEEYVCISTCRQLCQHLDMFAYMSASGGWINIKMPSNQYRKSHSGDKTILRPSYLDNGISYTGRWHLYIELGPWTCQHIGKHNGCCHLSVTWCKELCNRWLHY